ncbi:hypothetical protein VZT92_027804 [Zoarces viviparus]|uniref:Fucolectin tachylectin-4 pentraxin-1 domain-containing protein n=1 Tax=Zoarces viviparus TaxID=48416 RepID=A0AAW1DW66_ZOAVI
MKLSVLVVLLLLETRSAYTYENVALRGKATQSDRLDNSFSAAYNAIDGNRDANYYAGSCTHTDEMTNPWWRVDLLESYIVTSVIITNRGDCCAERLNGAQIHIGNSMNNPVVGTIPSAGPGESVTLTFTENVEGRYVIVALPGPGKYLTLCEVEVYGYRASTATETNLSVPSARCAVITSIPSGGVGEFQCNGTDGRYVTVVIPRQEYLTLCEVEVYGSPLD